VVENIQMPNVVDWLLIMDFNLMRSPEDRNQSGGDLNEMFLFNEAISALGVVELPLQGRKYTWTNKQDPPLLEKLDSFFTSNAWTSSFLGTLVTPCQWKHRTMWLVSSLLAKTSQKEVQLDLRTI
jgi:hypothetical protein